MTRSHFIILIIIAAGFIKSSVSQSTKPDDAACFKAMNETRLDVDKIVEASNTAQCKSSKNKFCYNIDWNAGLSTDEALEKKAFTCFDEITVYYGRGINFKCCLGFIQQTFRPRDAGAVVNTEPIHHLLCEDKRQVYINIKASWKVGNTIQNVDETKPLQLNDDLPDCNGNLAAILVKDTAGIMEPPPSKVLRSSIPFIILGLMIAMIAVCFLFSLYQKKRKEESSKMPKKPKKEEEGLVTFFTNGKKDQEVSKSKKSQDSKEEGGTDLDGADANARRLYSNANQDV